MKITAIRDITVPIRSEIRNAWISFSEMTASAVAIHTEAVRDGKPVVGYGFNSKESGFQTASLLLRCFVVQKSPLVVLKIRLGRIFDPFSRN